MIFFHLLGIVTQGLLKAYDASKKLIKTLTPNRTSDTLSTAELATAGFLSAIPTTAVTAPVERAKVLLQVCWILHSEDDFDSSCRFKGRVDRHTSITV
jgi:hypothetical protein